MRSLIMKHISKRLFRMSLSVMTMGLLSLLTSCGYQVGSLMHPQIKSIAIAPVKNDTYEVYASAILRNQLAERFQFDNSLKVASMETADCILYTRIVGISVAESTERSVDQDKTFRPSEYRMSLVVEYTVLIPGQAEPLVGRSFATGTSYYHVTNDPSIGRQNGLIQAALSVSKSIVTATTEIW